MSTPLITSEGSEGSTACFTTYYHFPYYAFTDSIGFGDNRFGRENVLALLKSAIKNSMVGYNRICICIPYDRISSHIRYYIDLLIAIFGKNILKWSTVVFTHCSNQTMTKEKYIETNRNDKHIIDIINSVQNVIFGDNMTDDEVDYIFVIRRKRFLDQLQEDMRKSNSSHYSPQPENFFEWIQAIFNIITLKHAKQLKTGVDEIKRISVTVADLMTHQNFAKYYGECSICLGDMWDRDSVFITCHHIFHKTCINQWLKDSDQPCPMCRTLLSRKSSFLTSPFFDWECIETDEVNQ